MYIEYSQHFGEDDTHNKYATFVTGSQGDYFLINKKGNFSTYDGIVRANGAAVTLATLGPVYPKIFGPQKIGSLAEVKTGYEWLRKFLLPSHSLHDSREPISLDERNRYNKMRKQLYYQPGVAQDCGHQHFASFNINNAALAAKYLFAVGNPYQYPVFPFKNSSVKVHYIPYP